MHLGHNNKYRDYTIKVQNAKVVLELVSIYYQLRTWVSGSMTNQFSSHIGHVVSKANQVLGLIKRSFVFKDIDIVKKLFTALFSPAFGIC